VLDFVGNKFSHKQEKAITRQFLPSIEYETEFITVVLALGLKISTNLEIQYEDKN
jgi:hypothetical protein